jgi:acetyl-CoA carboxylase biotin carboxyl carrier protein
MTMDFKQIQELVKLVSKTGIAEVSLETEEIKLKVKGSYNPSSLQVSPSPQIVMPQAMPTMQAPVAQSEAPSTASTEKQAEPNKEAAPAEDNSNLITFKSPIVGTFYRSPGPDKDAFVKVGDDVDQGDVLCIIEAMKLFNEIESEHSGKIVKILVEDASPVEFDQPLFLIEPK